MRRPHGSRRQRSRHLSDSRRHARAPEPGHAGPAHGAHCRARDEQRAPDDRRVRRVARRHGLPPAAAAGSRRSSSTPIAVTCSCSPCPSWRGPRRQPRGRFDVGALCEQALELRRYEHKRAAITAVLERPADGAALARADAPSILQAILNLIVNAEQALARSHGRQDDHGVDPTRGRPGGTWSSATAGQGPAAIRDLSSRS